MSRIRGRFRELRRQDRKALIPFITAGDPAPSATLPLMRAMVEAGADLIELGVPFSDPMADGPVIQRASERALQAGVSLDDTMAMVREFRAVDDATPVVLMGYLNPVEVMGYEQFAGAAADMGVDGVLTVDLPPEEGHDLVQALQRKEIDPIFLVAPTTTPARIQRICEVASGFVYYVSLKGVTGSDRLDVGAVAGKLQAIRNVTDLPIGVGFGIRDAASAASISTVSDAVVVGSALVQKIEELLGQPDRMEQAVTSLLSEMRQAMDKR